MIKISAKWNKVVRDLLLYKTRTILVVLAISVGVFAFGMVGTARIVISEQIDAGYAATDPATATLTVSAFDDDLVYFVQGLRGVGAVEGRYELPVRVEVGPDEWDTFYLFGVESLEETTVGHLSPQPGAMWPPARREIILERSTLAIPGFPQTNSILLEMPNGQEKTVEVVGTLYDMGQFPATFYKEGYGYVTLETLEWLTGNSHYNRLLVSLDQPGSQQDVEKAITDIRDRIEQEGYVVYSTTIPQDGRHWGANTIAAISAVLGVLGFLSLLLSGFLVINTVTALIKQQTRQIGIMKTIGGRNTHVFRFYLVTVLIFGLLASLIAIPAGLLGARGFVAYLAGFMNLDITPFTVPLPIVLIQLFVSLLVPLLVALIPIYNGVVIPAREAIYDQSTANALLKRDIFDRAVETVKGLPRPVLLSLRNTFRRKARVALTGITLVMAGAVFIAIFGLQNALNNQFDQIFGLFQYDVDLTFQEEQRMELLEREALRLDGVVGAEAWNSGLAQQVRSDGAEGANLPIFAIPPETDYVDAYIIEGRWLETGDSNAVVMSANLSLEDPDVYVGGPITLKVNGVEKDMVLVGVTAAIGDPTSDGFAYVNQEFYQSYWGAVDLANVLVLETVNHTIPSQTETSRDAIDWFKDTLGLEVISSTATGSFQEGITANISIMIRMYFIMAILLAIVGGLGLAGTLSLNVIERTREIGVMRAVGASNFMVWRVVVVEGVVISLISFAASLAFAIPIGSALTAAVGTVFIGMPMEHDYSPIGALIWAVLSIILAILASSLPARRATQISVRESLTYE